MLHTRLVAALIVTLSLSGVAAIPARSHHHHSGHHHGRGGHGGGNGGVNGDDSSQGGGEEGDDGSQQADGAAMQPVQVPADKSAVQAPAEPAVSNTPSTNSSSEVVDDLPDLALLDHVKAGKSFLYAVSTGKEMHDTRAKAVFDTWCSPLDACAYYSDAPNPKKTPTTITLVVPGADKIADPFRLAQLRYLRILSHASAMIMKNHGNLFSKNKWLIITDDDTYVFHHNMYMYLDALSAKKPIYTGHTLPNDVYPVDDDGHGHKLGSAVRTHFACGGGGSVFSHAGVELINPVVASCIEDTLPGRFMSDWNSDWMIGECAHRAGVTLVDQPPDHFGQFVYGEDSASKQPTDPGLKMFCVNDKDHDGRCKQPVSLHPFHEPKAMHYVWNTLSQSTTSLVKDYHFFLEDDGSVRVEKPGWVMKSNGNGTKAEAPSK